jgi:hypothetical protein
MPAQRVLHDVLGVGVVTRTATAQDCTPNPGAAAGLCCSAIEAGRQAIRPPCRPIGALRAIPDAVTVYSRKGDKPRSQQGGSTSARFSITLSGGGRCRQLFASAFLPSRSSGPVLAEPLACTARSQSSTTISELSENERMSRFRIRSGDLIVDGDLISRAGTACRSGDPHAELSARRSRTAGPGRPRIWSITANTSVTSTPRTASLQHLQQAPIGGSVGHGDHDPRSPRGSATRSDA